MSNAAEHRNAGVNQLPVPRARRFAAAATRAASAGSAARSGRACHHPAQGPHGAPARAQAGTTCVFCCCTLPGACVLPGRSRGDARVSKQPQTVCHLPASAAPARASAALRSRPSRASVVFRALAYAAEYACCRTPAADCLLWPWSECQLATSNSPLAAPALCALKAQSLSLARVQPCSGSWTTRSASTRASA